MPGDGRRSAFPSCVTGYGRFMVGSGAEVEQAERRLADAYERAREVSYQAGSGQMRELAAAELACQQARMGRREDPTDQQPP